MANGMPNRSPFRVEGPALQGFMPLAAEGGAITPLIVPLPIQGPTPGQVPFDFAGPAPGMVGVSQVGVRIPAFIPESAIVEIPRAKTEAMVQLERTRPDFAVQPSAVQMAIPTFAQLAPIELPTVLTPSFSGQGFNVPQFALIGPPSGAQLARQQFELPSTPLMGSVFSVPQFAPIGVPVMGRRVGGPVAARQQLGQQLGAAQIGRPVLLQPGTTTRGQVAQGPLRPGSDLKPEWMNWTGGPPDLVDQCGSEFKGYVNEEFGRLFDLLSRLDDESGPPSNRRQYYAELKADLERIKREKALWWGQGGEMTDPRLGKSTWGATVRLNDGGSIVILNWSWFSTFRTFDPCGLMFWRLFATLVNELDSARANRISGGKSRASEIGSSLAATTALRDVRAAIAGAANGQPGSSSAANEMQEWTGRRRCLEDTDRTNKILDYAIAEEKAGAAVEAGPGE